MDMPLALHTLLMRRYEDIATDIKTQAFAALGKDRPLEGWPATDERRIRHETLMGLHQALRKYRRMWDQPTQPLVRKTPLGLIRIRTSLFDVFDQLVKCRPYLNLDGPAGEVHRTKGKLNRTWHYLYLAHALDQVVASDPLKKLGAMEKTHAGAVATGGIGFTLFRFFPELNGSDIVGEYKVNVVCNRIGSTIGEELELIAHVLDVAGPEYLEVCRNPERWEPREPRYVREYEAAKAVVQNLMEGLTRDKALLLARHPRAAESFFRQALTEMC